MDEVPKDLTKKEMVIGSPFFEEEIAEICKYKFPKDNLTNISFLRDILTVVGNAYHNMPGLFNEFRINLANYLDVVVKSQEDVQKVIRKILNEQYPELLHNAIGSKIKNRPMHIEVIYFVGEFHYQTSFAKNGINELLSKDVETYRKNFLEAKRSNAGAAPKAKSVPQKKHAK
jgi:hypothetical protein